MLDVFRNVKGIVSASPVPLANIAVYLNTLNKVQLENVLHAGRLLIDSLPEDMQNHEDSLVI